MISRRVVKERESFYVNIPAGIAEELGIKKGFEVWLFYLPHVGVFVVPPSRLHKMPGFIVGADRESEESYKIRFALKKKWKCQRSGKKGYVLRLMRANLKKARERAEEGLGKKVVAGRWARA